MEHTEILSELLSRNLSNLTTYLVPEDKKATLSPFETYCTQELGRFGGIHYLHHSSSGDYVLLQNGSEPLWRAFYGFGDVGNWYREEDKSDQPRVDAIVNVFREQRGNGVAEFREMLTNIRRRSKKESLLDILFCEDGEISTFLLEWKLREVIDTQRDNNGKLSKERIDKIKKWMKGEIDQLKFKKPFGSNEYDESFENLLTLLGFLEIDENDKRWLTCRYCRMVKWLQKEFQEAQHERRRFSQEFSNTDSIWDEMFGEKQRETFLKIYKNLPCSQYSFCTECKSKTYIELQNDGNDFFSTYFSAIIDNRPDEDADHFKQRSRFNLEGHFLFRSDYCHLSLLASPKRKPYFDQGTSITVDDGKTVHQKHTLVFDASKNIVGFEIPALQDGKNKGYFVGVFKDLEAPFNSDIDSHDFSEFKEKIHQIRSIESVVATIGFSKNLKDQYLAKALRSAVSSVFARNYAHNIGAHVKRRATIQEIRKRIEELYPSVLQNGSNSKIVHDWVYTMKERIDLYEINRNEFLADYRLPPKEVMFYRDVILPFAENTLIMDNIAASEGITYQAGGVHNKLIVRVFIDGAEIEARYPLLQRFECDNRYLEEQKTNQCEIRYPDHFPYLVKSINDSTDLAQALNQKALVFPRKNGESDSPHDVAIVLPSEHTFFSILENFIRNSAKHNKSKLEKKNEDLITYIALDDKKEDGSSDPEFYYLTIFDNVSSVSPSILCGSETLGLLRRLDDSLLDETGEPKRENLGIADMKINAHLLASSENITDELLKKALQIVVLDKLPEGNGCDAREFHIVEQKNYAGENDKERIQNLEAFLSQISPESESPQGIAVKNYRFGYRFRLAKAKKICWIGKADQVDTIKKLKEKGIYLFKSFDELKDTADKSIAMYQFAILEMNLLEPWNVDADADRKEKLKSELQNILLKLPYRVLVNNANPTKVKGILAEFVARRQLQPVESPITYGLEKEDFDYTILKTCWENWLLRWLKQDTGKRKPHLVLYFENENSDWRNFEGNDFFNFTQLFEQNSESTPMVNIQSDKEICVTFGQHGGGLRKFTTQLSWKDHSFQSIGKGSADFASIFYPPYDKRQKELLCYELLEAGLLRILVLDERICANLHDDNEELRTIKDSMRYDMTSESSNPTVHWHRAAIGRLFLANEFLGKSIVPKKDQGTPSFRCAIRSQNLNNVDLEIGFRNLEVIHPFDSIIIHRTFLNEEWIGDKIVGNTLEDRQKNLLDILKKKVPFIVVISGGGTVHGVKGYYKFKPLGSFGHLFGQQFAKFQIAKMSMT